MYVYMYPSLGQGQGQIVSGSTTFPLNEESENCVNRVQQGNPKKPGREVSKCLQTPSSTPGKMKCLYWRNLAWILLTLSVQLGLNIETDYNLSFVSPSFLAKSRKCAHLRYSFCIKAVLETFLDLCTYKVHCRHFSDWHLLHNHSENLKSSI